MRKPCESRAWPLRVPACGVMLLASCSVQQPLEAPTGHCLDYTRQTNVGQPLSGPEESRRRPATSTPSHRSVLTKEDLERQQACLNVEKTRLEALKLDQDLRNISGQLTSWGWLILVLQNFAVVAAVVGAFIGGWRYLVERRAGREEGRNSRFDRVVAGLGSEVPDARIGAAALLPTFLEKGYERFFVPVFRLAAAYLTPDGQGDGGTPSRASTARRRIGHDRSAADPVDQLLGSVLKTAYPLALGYGIQARMPRLAGKIAQQSPLRLLRGPSGNGDERWTAETLVATLDDAGKTHVAKQFASENLNAEGIVLDGVHLSAGQFPLAWFHKASFRYADAKGIDLRQARLTQADFTRANLEDARLPGAVVEGANFTGAKLGNADARAIVANTATPTDDDPEATRFNEAELGGVLFDDADLTGALFQYANFDRPETTRRCTIEQAVSLKGADFTGARGLTPMQAEICRGKGAKNIRSG